MRQSDSEQTSDDLVRRLRARVQRSHVAADKWSVIPDPLCQEAADEIERLRAERLEAEGLVTDAVQHPLAE